MVRLRWLGIVPPLLTVLLTEACGAERAVRVEIDVADDGDRLCLVARSAGEIQFAQAYRFDALPEGERSLTFVAGDRSSEDLTVSAWVARSGQVVATASARVRFADQGTVAQVLRPRRCHLGGPSGVGARPGGTFAALGASPRAIAADLDGDGRDELLAIGADGSLQVLDAADRDAGSRRASELRSADGRLVAVGDLDEDCRLEVVVAAPTGALVVIGADGSSPSPIGGAASDVASGLALAGQPALVIAGASGLLLTPWDEDAPRSLATGAWSHVATGDLTGDGRVDLVAAGESGTRAFVGDASGAHEETGALPSMMASATGPIAIGDLDADGFLDLASASDATLRIAINRGDGLLEDRTGTAPTLGGAIVRIELVDLDGDCADEIVVLDAMGAVSVLGRDARGMLVPRTDVPSGLVLDVVAIDADGDGARELALLAPGGAVTLWRP